MAAFINSLAWSIAPSISLLPIPAATSDCCSIALTFGSCSMLSSLVSLATAILFSAGSSAIMSSSSDILVFLIMLLYLSVISFTFSEVSGETYSVGLNFLGSGLMLFLKSCNSLNNTSCAFIAA